MVEATDIAGIDPKYMFNLIEARLKAGVETLVVSSIGFIAYRWYVQLRRHCELCYHAPATPSYSGTASSPFHHHNG
ncbi:hypothetical protein DAKH74_033480 [Maudiozyma humilis]|uniref:Uncharacterized protein n=1 Tax=Maudiozyma humilis TaxID=51915 RepID=A0AAV5RZE0_MAUHU|nr:hypothetical protein DAKH74_033480 [Kazachstania humilis]